MCETCTRYFINPVRVGTKHGLARINETVIQAVDRIIHILPRGRIENRDRHSCRGIKIQTIVAGICNGVKAVVQCRLCHSRGIFLGVAQVHCRLAGVELGCDIGLEIDIDLTGIPFPALGCDNNHTVGGTRTINRRRGGILKHLHALDIVHVKRIERSRCRNAVDYEQGILRGIERTDTTYAHSTDTARRPVAAYSHTGHTSLQRTHGVGIRGGAQTLCAYH